MDILDIWVLFYLLVEQDTSPDKMFLAVPQYYPSVHKSRKPLQNSFAFYTLFIFYTVWNNLPDEVRSVPTLACYRKKLKSYLIEKAFLP